MSKETKRTTPSGEKKSWGGKRKGAGRKKQDKVGVKLTINAGVLHEFKEKYPHKTSMRVEEMMREDLNQ